MCSNQSISLFLMYPLARINTIFFHFFSRQKHEGPPVSKDCQNTIWRQMTMFMDKTKLPSLLKPYCSQATPQDCSKYDKSGDLACWLDHLGEITDQLCYSYLQRVEQAVFTNLQLYQHFLTECSNDVLKHSCGRLSNDHEVCVYCRGDTSVLVCHC